MMISLLCLQLFTLLLGAAATPSDGSQCQRWSSFGGSSEHTGYYGAATLKVPPGDPITLKQYQFQQGVSTPASHRAGEWFVAQGHGYQQVVEEEAGNGWFFAPYIHSCITTDGCLTKASAPALLPGRSVVYGHVCNATMTDGSVYSNVWYAIHSVTGRPLWHTAQFRDQGLCVTDATFSPLVTEHVVIGTVSNALLAFNRTTGALVWSLRNAQFMRGGRPASYWSAKEAALRIVVVFDYSIHVIDEITGEIVRAQRVPTIVQPTSIVKNPIIDQQRELLVLQPTPFTDENYNSQCESNTTVIRLDTLQLVWSREFCLGDAASLGQYQDWTPTLAKDTGELYVPYYGGIHVVTVDTGETKGEIIFPNRMCNFNRCVGSQPIASTTHLIVPMATGDTYGVSIVDRKTLNQTWITKESCCTYIPPFIGVAFGRLFITTITGDKLPAIFTIGQQEANSDAPTSGVPTTAAPTTDSPTAATPAPTTDSPTVATPAPTSLRPTSLDPTTDFPTPAPTARRHHLSPPAIVGVVVASVAVVIVIIVAAICIGTRRARPGYTAIPADEPSSDNLLG